MRAVFIHDHVFKECNENYYSEGKLTAITWQRYLKYVDELTIIGRSEAINEGVVTEYSLSSCDNVLFKCIKSIKLIDRLLTSNIDRFLESIIIDCDFVICRLPSFLGIRAFYAAKRLGKKILIELVGCPYDALKHHGSLAGKILAPIERHKLQKAIAVADYTVYVTNHFLQKRYPTKGNSAGISNVELLPSKLKYSNQVFGNEDTFKIGFIGSLNSKYKGLNDLIVAISQLSNPNIELHILGSGSRDEYITLAKSIEVSHQLYFHKPIVGGTEILNWLSQHDLYIQPSHTEGLPRALIEAMSVGLPCIGSRVGGIPELLSDTALFNAKNIDELSIKINGFMKDKVLREEQSELNSETSKKFFFETLAANRAAFFNVFFGQ
jgi:glycosyltransferase involved in cell wall biosynthesis